MILWFTAEEIGRAASTGTVDQYRRQRRGELIGRVPGKQEMQDRMRNQKCGNYCSRLSANLRIQAGDEGHEYREQGNVRHNERHLASLI